MIDQVLFKIEEQTTGTLLHPVSSLYCPGQRWPNLRWLPTPSVSYPIRERQLHESDLMAFIMKKHYLYGQFNALGLGAILRHFGAKVNRHFVGQSGEDFKVDVFANITTVFSTHANEMLKTVIRLDNRMDR